MTSNVFEDMIDDVRDAIDFYDCKVYNAMILNDKPGMFVIYVKENNDDD